jgi:hypothetical protein
MKTYKHSGTLGDLIYSLPVMAKMGGGEYKVAIGNIENCVAKYSFGNPAWAQVDPAHQGRFTENDYNWLAPLLERQSYISKVSKWYPGDAETDVDLDHFRGTLFRGFEGNYNEAYHRAFGIPFTPADYEATWLEADAKTIAPVAVVRSFRYRCPNGDAVWQALAEDGQLQHNGVFLGTEAEHKDFVKVTGCNIPLHPVSNFKELADIIAGADLFMGNQTFANSLAVGLGKDCVLETIKIKPLVNNECYWHQRSNIQYF